MPRFCNIFCGCFIDEAFLQFGFGKDRQMGTRLETECDLTEHQSVCMSAVSPP
jgi:hypothetical protein